jgi:hypothetical protein
MGEEKFCSDSYFHRPLSSLSSPCFLSIPPPPGLLLASNTSRPPSHSSLTPHSLLLHPPSPYAPPAWHGALTAGARHLPGSPALAILSFLVVPSPARSALAVAPPLALVPALLPQPRRLLLPGTRHTPWFQPSSPSRPLPWSFQWRIERSQVFGWRRSEASATFTMCSTKGLNIRSSLFLLSFEST